MNSRMAPRIVLEFHARAARRNFQKRSKTAGFPALTGWAKLCRAYGAGLETRGLAGRNPAIFRRIAAEPDDFQDHSGDRNCAPSASEKRELVSEPPTRLD